MTKFYFRIFPVLLLQIQTTIHASAIVPGCEDCGCCVQNVCATTVENGHSLSSYCTRGCIPGIFGHRCYQKCPEQCLTCERNYGKTCESCVEGKYLSSGNCSSCNDRCKSCTSTTQCQECNLPYYNHGDVTDCSLSCPGNCLCQDIGVCSSCQEGYYNIQNKCQDSCPDKCRTCSDQNTCQNCKDGYYNGKTDDNSKGHEVFDCSLSCRDNCTRCDSHNECSHCKQGYHGTYCQHKCSEGCQKGVCAIADGSCTCKDGFTGSICSECMTGKFGNTCNLTCPITCKENKCERSTGHCFECNFVNITGDTCDQCKTGTWDITCSSVCPGSCFGRECIRETGFCKSCSGNFIGERCENCIRDYYGNECNKECPKNCRESYCHRNTGSCTSCKGNYAGPTCNYCKNGMYGTNCAFNCPSNQCSNNTCDRYTGNCTSCQHGFYGSLCDVSCSPGCKNGSCDFRTGSCFACSTKFSGDKCCIQDGHCLTCSSNTVCETCSDGFYGDGCDKECPALCKYAKKVSGVLRCDRKTGMCSLCEDGFHGDFCNLTCSHQCLNNRCNKDSGHCSEGCLNGYEGPTCTDAVNTLGMAIGISSVVTSVVAIILMTASFIILRKWFKKVDDMMKLLQEPKNQTSYTNTEFQASETADDNAGLSDIQEYEELNERIDAKTSDYYQIQ